MHFPLHHPALILSFTEAEEDWEGTRIFFFVLEYLLVTKKKKLIVKQEYSGF